MTYNLMGCGAAEGLWRHNNGRHLGRHLLFYKELEIRCKPREIYGSFVLYMKNNTKISTLHDFSHKIFFYCWKKLKKTCIFTQKWLDHLLLMTSYLVTIATDHHLLVSKCARGMNEQLLKTSGTDVLSFRKKTPKNLMGGGIHSRPLPCTSEG